MRINEYARETNLKDSDDYIIDTNTGTYRTTGKDLKGYVNDNRESNELSLEGDDAADKSKEYVNVQNEDTGEHTKVSLETLSKEIVGEFSPSNYEDGELPEDRNDSANMYLVVEDGDGNKKKISIDQLLHYIPAKSYPGDIVQLSDSTDGTSFGGLVGYSGAPEVGTQGKVEHVDPTNIRLIDPVADFSNVDDESITGDESVLITGKAPLLPAIHKMTINQLSDKIKNDLPNTLHPKGSVLFAELPAISDADKGDMYNIRDNFTTTNDFREGSGYDYPLGSNVYKTEDGKWDVMAGPGVIGIKGFNEENYHQGLVNITPGMIGLSIVNSTTIATIMELVQLIKNSSVNNYDSLGGLIATKIVSNLIDFDESSNVYWFYGYIKLNNMITDLNGDIKLYLSGFFAGVPVNIVIELNNGEEVYKKLYSLNHISDVANAANNKVVFNGGAEAIKVNSNHVSNGGNMTLIQFKSSENDGAISQNLILGSHVGAHVDRIANIQIPFSFGIDSNGNYGYIKGGADTVTPFLSFTPYNLVTSPANVPLILLKKTSPIIFEAGYIFVPNKPIDVSGKYVFACGDYEEVVKELSKIDSRHYIYYGSSGDISVVMICLGTTPGVYEEIIHGVVMKDNKIICGL